MPAKINSLLTKARKHPQQVWMILASVLLIAITLTYFATSYGKPIMGLVLVYDNNRWTVENVENDGIGIIAGIKRGDVPIQVNGQPADQFLNRYVDEGRVFGVVIQQIEVSGLDGQTKVADIEGSSVPLSNVIEIILLLINCIIFWSVGLFVYFKRPDNPAAVLLALTGLVFSLIVGSQVAGERGVFAALQISVVSSLLTGWILLHFFLVLPEERVKFRRSRLTLLIYVVPFISIFFFLLIGVRDGQPLPWYYTLRMIEYALVMLGILAVAVINFNRAKSPRTRQQMKIVAVSCFYAIIPFLIVFLLPMLITRQTYFATGYIVFFLGLIPLGMGYAVVTQKMLDIDVIIRRGVIYGIISVIMGLLLAAGIFIINVFYGESSNWFILFVSIILGVIGTVLFGPITRATERIVDKLFYKDRYDYRQIIHRLSLSLNNFQDISDISRLIVGTTATTLNLSGACLIIRGQTSFYDVSAAEGSLLDQDKHAKLLAMIRKRDPLYEFPNSATAINPDLAFFIPLKTWEKETGFLCVSPKTTRQYFSGDDLYLLQGLASVASTALRSVMLNRDVSLRDTFVSIASHELRTPLTSIIGYADLLVRKDPPTDTRRQWLKNILDNSQKIADMVDELLNVSRIQSGKINLKISEVYLNELVDDRLPLYIESTSKHSFKLELPENLPPVKVDRDKSGQVIGNLISNAIKYSPQGGNITVSGYPELERGRVVISVKDEGIGIAEEDIQTLFKTFHRIQRKETTVVRGSGLGLYIAKEWVEAMGGEVWLTSELNKGSTFFVSFPIASLNPEADKAAREAQRSSG
jgi:signal transduction histidine kinase